MASTLTSDCVDPLQLSPQEVSFFQAEGYLCLPGLVSASIASELRDETLFVLEQLGMTRQQLCKASSSADKLRQSSQFLGGSRLEQLVYSANLLRAVEQLLGGPSTTYLPFTAVKAGGGGGMFHFHQDNQYTRHDGPSINVWVALDRMTPDNGCLCVVPRSHLAGTLDSRVSGDGDTHQRVLQDPTEYLPVRMNPGDAIAFTRLTVHGSGPNVTDQPRVAYALQFHRNDTRYRKPDGTWALLKDEPRWQIKAVDRIGP